MKKWLRQVNRGAILLVIVLLAVFVYLIIDAENTSKDKKTLTQISEKYIRNSYILYQCPEDLDFWSDEASLLQDLPAILLTQAEPLNQYFCDNEAVRNEQVSLACQFYISFYRAERLPITCTRVPTSIKIEEVYHDSASIYVTVENTFEYVDMSGRQSTFSYTSSDTLSFLKQDGEWKLLVDNSDLDELSYY
ncbi:MAG: hypothetical protein J6T40_05725 [Clostridiales bacterium]|nr:hypothetical protein [Clostridiales bacterium]